MSDEFVDWKTPENQAILNSMPRGQSNTYEPIDKKYSAFNGLTFPTATKAFPTAYTPTGQSDIDTARQGMTESMNQPYTQSNIYNEPMVQNQQTTPYGYNQVDQNAFDLTNPSSWFSDPKYENVLKDGFKLVDGKPVEMNQTEKTGQARERALNKIADNTGTSWSDWANIGLGGLGTAMQLGMYGDRRDYLEGSVDALRQQTQNAEEAHNTKLANNASYGSAFSRNA